MSLENLRLFVVMLGGRHPRANTEVHDVVFAIGPTIEQTYPQLREQWFGEAAGLHLDSWMAVDGVEDWQVRLSQVAPAADAQTLFFVNLGGYVEGEFGEAHSYLLVVAADAAEAKRKALAQAQAQAQWIKPHRDALLEVDSCLPVGPIGGLHVQLRAGAHAGIHSQSDYIVIS
ncbi:hypothetical protein ABB27_01385 [Stenotrophomonas terrae]|uniref:DUF1543 domain-containing protein n=1 Tax=Stenotrophomonas terrae TaxID=405446 RepID=A0A0R0CR46_9GAMM|nr:DUF1543 domain-containing protein [Stenotrophomonas terrae]KRG72345.1 hypothetical protein ABB27_01385 [Stenotrophomonas terrae]